MNDLRPASQPPAYLPAAAQRRSETADYTYIIRLVYERSRIRLHDGKEALIRSRLGKRMRHHGFESLGQYCDYLRHGDDAAEITHMIDALTTNITHILREEQHFQYLVQITTLKDSVIILETLQQR